MTLVNTEELKRDVVSAARLGISSAWVLTDAGLAATGIGFDARDEDALESAPERLFFNGCRRRVNPIATAICRSVRAPA
jgi:hypothetical protein